MRSQPIRLLPLAGKTIVVHTVTYVLMGVLASSLLDYESRFAGPQMACWMRQFSDPLIMAGPLFQPVRGLVFALVLYPLRDLVFLRARGWLLASWILVALGVVSTFGPAPGSIEGMVYTTIPVGDQLLGYLEVVPQALLLAAGVAYWVEHPAKRWFARVMVAAFVAAIGLPLLGVLSRASGS